MRLTNREAFAIFRNRDFKFFISAKFLVTCALQMQAVAIGWQVFKITNDPLALGYSGLAEAIPAISIALFGGYLADKIDRRLILICTTAALVVGASILFTLSLPTFTPQVWALYFIISLTGLARGFYGPANFALLSQIVPRHQYAQSAAWNSTFWEIATVMGAAAGGLIIGFVGLSVTYGLIAAFLTSAMFLFSTITKRPMAKSKVAEGLFENLGMGIRFVFKNKIVLGALTLDMVAVLFGGAVAMLPMFAEHILSVGPQGFGLLRAAPSIGAFTMALILANRPPVHNSGQKLLVCVAAYSTCMILFAVSTSFYLSIFLLVLSGVFDNVSVVIRSTLLQIHTPDEMRGRVSAVNSIFINSSNEIGAFESGLTARLFGLIPSVLFGGFISIVSVIGIGTKFKQLTNADLVDTMPAK